MELTLLADGGIQPRPQAYERRLVFKGWDELDPIRLAQVVIKVARTIEASETIVSVWSVGDGWTEAHRIAGPEFWYKVPSFSRWQQERAETKTYEVAESAMSELTEIARNGALP